MSATITTGYSMPLNSENAPFGGSDIILEVVHALADATTITITCGGDASQTDKIRHPLKVMVQPTDVAGSDAGHYYSISGHVITISGVASGDDFDVWIIGRP